MGFISAIPLPKKVVLHDFRLGLLHTFLRVLALGWVSYTMLFGELPAYLALSLFLSLAEAASIVGPLLQAEKGRKASGARRKEGGQVQRVLHLVYLKRRGTTR